MDKVPSERAFLDLSDYARPAARGLVRWLLPTPITPIHLTLAFTLVGGCAAFLLALNRALPLAGLLLLLKSLLDAADGSLARARGRPSRVGRFLDSVCDFGVMALVFAGLALGRGGGALVFGWAFVALMSATLQGSVFSYYSVRYRAENSGDTTSQIDEAEANGYAWDNPQALQILHRLYRLIYAWQDKLMDKIDRWLIPMARPLRREFMTATTVLGLGTQLLIIAVCLIAGRPGWALGLFPTVFNGYWLALLVFRRFLT